MKMSNGIAVLVTMLFLLASSSALAAVPHTMTYHGNLSSSGGAPVDAVVEATFSIHDAESDGSEVWSEEISSVDVVAGSFSASLGATESLEGVFDGNDYWLEITIDGETLSPRTPVNSVPYAMKAARSDDAQTIRGMAPEDFAGSSDASAIEFDNTGSDLAATDLQAAIAELSQQVNQLQAALADKADQSDLAALQSTVAEKANQSEVDSLDTRMTVAEGTISNHTADISTNTANISSNAGAITALENLTQDIERTTINGYTSLVFEAVNLHLRNGLGSTDGSDDITDLNDTAVNGLGNLIVGYDEERVSGSSKNGSHNLVVGPRHNYSSIGGLIAGRQNETSGIYSSVIGGSENVASGERSSVSGGRSNRATAQGSSVIGGLDNAASGVDSSVSGGVGNVASGVRSSVSSGWQGVASGSYATVIGGSENVASGNFSTVSGGNNEASGSSSTVSGGQRNLASGTGSSVSGGYENEARGVSSSVSGGRTTTITGEYNWAAGDLFQDQ